MKLRILMCPEYFYPHIGGSEVWSWQVARHLVQRGHEVHVLTYKHPGYTSDHIQDGIHIHKVGPFPIEGIQPYFRRALIQGTGIIHKGLQVDFDIILAIQTFSLIPALILSKLKKRPIIAVYHDVYGFKFSLKDKGLLKGLIRGSVEHFTLIQKYNKIITVSNSTFTKLNRYEINKQKIKVIYEGVDLESMDSIKAIKSIDPLVLYVGRLVAHKRVEDLIEAFNIIHSNASKAKLVIVGTGPMRQHLEAYASQLKLSEYVEFTGFVSENRKIQLMKQAHVLVLPSIMEGFGLVLVEAMACRTPVIAVNRGGPKEVVTDKETGFLVPPFQPKEIAKKIHLLLYDLSLQQEMGKKARLRVEEHFNWEKTAERIEDLFIKVLNK